jgi:hypothetical protein
VQFIILFGLAVAWGVLLVPDLLKKRGTVRSIRGVKGFDRQLSAFNRTSGGPMSRSMPGVQGMPGMQSRTPGSVVAFPVRGPVRRPRQHGLRSVPHTPADAQRRRIYVLATLFASAVLTLAFAMAVTRLALALHFVIDLALALYVYLLFELRANRDKEFEDDVDVDEFEDDVAMAQG